MITNIEIRQGLLIDLVATRCNADSLSESCKKHFENKAIEAQRQEPFTVTDKPQTPPGGTRHDYWSMGPYWWPDPDSPDRLPYIRRDGEVNPEIQDERFDALRLDGMSKAVTTLTQGWLVTEQRTFAERAVLLLRTFFLDPTTRMNPSLTYAQSIPGICEGRCIGLIETEELIPLLDWIIVLHEDGILPTTEFKALQDWFTAYLDWLLESDHGQQERNQHNNHGTMLDAQLVAFALFVGRDEVTKSVLEEVPARRIDMHIEPDGSQPHELERTRSWTYSRYNLTGLMMMAWMARHVGVDLWNYQSEDGRSMRAALDFLVPYATANKTWPYPQLDEHQGAENLLLGRKPGLYLSDLLVQAARAWDEPGYLELAKRKEPERLTSILVAWPC